MSLNAMNKNTMAHQQHHDKTLPFSRRFKLASYLTSVMLFIGTSLLSSNLLAQPMYHVELLIFENPISAGVNNYANSDDSESWPWEIDLRWPEPRIDILADQTGSDVFTKIKKTELTLGPDNYALRTNGYRILWHHAWQQPLLNQQQSPWIDIRAGNLYNQRHELEGGIQIYLSRYLHLKTQLWKTTFSSINQPNANHLFHWSQLPTALPSLNGCEFINTQWPQNMRNDAFPYGCVSPIEDQQATSDSEVPSVHSIDDDTQSTKPVLTETAFAPANLGIEKIVTMNDSRRMRGGELHYIDHPHMGILARVTLIDNSISSDASATDTSVLESSTINSVNNTGTTLGSHSDSITGHIKDNIKQ